MCDKIILCKVWCVKVYVWCRGYKKGRSAAALRPQAYLKKDASGSFQVGQLAFGKFFLGILTRDDEGVEFVLL